MSKELKARLRAGETLIADGATGTILMAAGLPPGTPPELWNVQRPEQILQLHRSYLDSGSQIILTNTFGGSRIKLATGGLDDRTRELNQAAVALAREAAGTQAFVAGDIGPTGELMAPYGSLTFEKAVEVFAEQAEALAGAGADLVWIETVMDLEEARAAVTGARQACDLPVFCSLSFGPRGRTMMGVKASQAASELWPLGLAAIGANCGEGIDVVEPVLREMREVLPEAPLIAKPNAGLPKLVGDRTVYDMEPAAFAARIPEFVGLGAQIVGACCGSNPAHIAAVSKIVRGRAG
jgi:5-methyltetrahydrofolate--homocysteine methyltransferase